jgi:hypothetical protein
MWVVLPFVALNLAALYHWTQAARNLTPSRQVDFWSFLTGWVHVPDDAFTEEGAHHRALAIKLMMLSVVAAGVALGIVLVV